MFSNHLSTRRISESIARNLDLLVTWRLLNFTSRIYQAESGIHIYICDLILPVRGLKIGMSLESM